MNKNKDDIISSLVFGFGGVLLIVLISFLMSWPVMFLWNNCLIDAVDGLHEIGWFQAWGISALFGFLFKSNFKSK
jgi:hypothetical protein